MSTSLVRPAREDLSTMLLAAAAFAIFGVLVLLAYAFRWQWTGLPAFDAEGDGAGGRPAKTLWDWLQLLGIPVALAALAFLLNNAQTRREQQREDQQAARQRTIAADADRESTLRAYLAQMSDLLLDRRLLRSKPGADVRTIARTTTLSAVRRLDGPRRGLVVQFLNDAFLLKNGESGGPPPVVVFMSDLQYAELARSHLGKANLNGANLGGAVLSGAILSQADLGGANLSGANLSGANLHEANLSGANLIETPLIRADLSGANLHAADLRGANLVQTTLGGANLSGADLTGADLRGARGADLAGTHGKPLHGP
jgi:uncharacterized protein YjbI with pentapeptide repeats